MIQCRDYSTNLSHHRCCRNAGSSGPPRPPDSGPSHRSPHKPCRRTRPRGTSCVFRLGFPECEVGCAASWKLSRPLAPYNRSPPPHASQLQLSSLWGLCTAVPPPSPPTPTPATPSGGLCPALETRPHDAPIKPQPLPPGPLTPCPGPAERGARRCWVDSRPAVQRAGRATPPTPPLGPRPHLSTCLHALLETVQLLKQCYREKAA